MVVGIEFVVRKEQCPLKHRPIASIVSLSHHTRTIIRYTHFSQLYVSMISCYNGKKKKKVSISNLNVHCIVLHNTTLHVWVYMYKSFQFTLLFTLGGMGGQCHRYVACRILFSIIVSF